MIEHSVEHSISGWGFTAMAGPCWVLGISTGLTLHKSLKTMTIPSKSFSSAKRQILYFSAPAHGSHEDIWRSVGALGPKLRRAAFVCLGTSKAGDAAGTHADHSLLSRTTLQTKCVTSVILRKICPHRKSGRRIGSLPPALNLHRVAITPQRAARRNRASQLGD